MYQKYTQIHIIATQNHKQYAKKFYYNGIIAEMLENALKMLDIQRKNMYNINAAFSAVSQNYLKFR